jgi:hypothetical protein
MKKAEPELNQKQNAGIEPEAENLTTRFNYDP